MNTSKDKHTKNSESKSYRYVILVTVVAVVTFGFIMFSLFEKLKHNRSQQTKAIELIVWTHSSFMDSYGPGWELKSLFEKTCDCRVVYVDAGGTSMAIEKLKLSPDRRVDVVLGVDFLQLDRFLKSIRAQNLNAPNINWDPQVKSFILQRAIPYDWSPMGFIYRKGEVEVAKTLDEALQKLPGKSLALQDPTMSTPGLEFLYWIFSENGQTLDSRLDRLKPKVHSYSPSWSTAYGLFRKKQTPVVFSYLTSLVYHWEKEQDEAYDFMNFKTGHPVQLEYAVVPENCWSCGVAKEFVDLLLSTEGQKIIAEKNYMLPVNLDARLKLNKNFQRLPEVKVIPISEAAKFTNQLDEILKKWGEGRSLK